MLKSLRADGQALAGHRRNLGIKNLWKRLKEHIVIIIDIEYLLLLSQRMLNVCHIHFEIGFFNVL